MGSMSSRRFFWLLIAISAVVLAVGYVAFSPLGTELRAPQVIPVTAQIVLTDKGFEPQEVWVRAGGMVTFTTDRGRLFWPASDPHPSHSIYPDFDPRTPVAADGE